MTNVLVIDDDDEIRGMLRELLARAGYGVRTASHGREGLHLLREGAVDLVITDILMPVQEGIETIVELKRISPHLKVIAMSGGGIVQPEDYLKTAETLGAELTIAKPFEVDDILQAVQYLLCERRHPSDAHASSRERHSSSTRRESCDAVSSAARSNGGERHGI